MNPWDSPSLWSNALRDMAAITDEADRETAFARLERMNIQARAGMDVEQLDRDRRKTTVFLFSAMASMSVQFPRGDTRELNGPVQVIASELGLDGADRLQKCQGFCIDAFTAPDFDPQARGLQPYYVNLMMALAAVALETIRRTAGVPVVSVRRLTLFADRLDDRRASILPFVTRTTGRPALIASIG